MQNEPNPAWVQVRRGLAGGLPAAAPKPAPLAPPPDAMLDPDASLDPDEAPDAEAWAAEAQSPG